MTFKTWMQAQQVMDRMRLDDSKIVAADGGFQIVKMVAGDAEARQARLLARKQEEKAVAARQDETIRSLVEQLIAPLADSTDRRLQSLARSGQALLDGTF